MSSSYSAQIVEVKRSWLKFPSICKSIVFSRLSKLHTGTLTIIDGDGESTFGETLANESASLHATVLVNDHQFYTNVVGGGSLGAAEAFMTGDWSTPDLTAVVRLMARNMDVMDEIEGGLAVFSLIFRKVFHRLNQNTEKGSRRNIAAHYDLGNSFFKLFLDPTMTYSSGIFPSLESTMEEASIHKLDTVCRKLDLGPNDHVLEIGTGWGGFATYAASHYGCKVTSTTISSEQYKLAKQKVEELGLSDRITILNDDYRLLTGTYDKLVSIEMIEAVGWKYYGQFFDACSRLLKSEGLMLLQAITIQDQRYESARKNVDFIQRYIFPGSCIPSIQALLSASTNSSDLNLIDQRDYAGHYARTLRCWLNTFKENETEIALLGYSETFRRMWEFYLCYCEGGFMERTIGVSHMLFAKPKYSNRLTQ